MRSGRTVIAIDGPAASGKSSTAKWVAEVLEFRHIDSGALYRAATLAALKSGREPVHWNEMEVVHDATGRVTVAVEGENFEIRIDGKSVEGEIRSPHVTANVSAVAQMPAVRLWVNAWVRRLAQDHDVVVDGRDMGTAVFPDATLKIFLVADPWERARRRLIQTFRRVPTEEEIAAETEQLVSRDARDATQTVQAKDAILIDTTSLTQSEQVERIAALARAVTRDGKSSSAVDS